MIACNEKTARRHFAVRVLRLLFVLLPVAVLAAAGCQQREAAVTPNRAKSTRPATDSNASAKDGIWEAFYLQGAKIGYGHTTTREVVRDGRRLVETHSTNHLAITRFGQKAEQDLTLDSLETPEGSLLEFQTRMDSGGSPAVVTGHREGAEMVVTTETQGRSESMRIAWNDDVGGFRAVEQSLEREPLRPGETRSLKMLMPLVNQIARVELTAAEVESTPLLGVEARLLHIASVAQLGGGQSIASDLWADEKGQVVKTRVAALRQESIVTSRELALAPAAQGGAFDIGLDLIVKVEPPLERPHQTQRVVYRVELTDGDPAKAFATGPTQAVKSLGPHAAEITVHSLRPLDAKQPQEPAATPGEEFTSANSVLQTDDPRIAALAREAKGDATDPAEIAARLEQFVHRTVSEKNFSHAFATAAEVAQTREGDCTEHAVLLAALARACGIPSRVAIGLVYVTNADGFGYHMWTEVYLRGQWVPLDAIVGQGGTSAAYLKLTDSSLAGASAYSSFLAVANVLGQLKVRVLAQQ